MVSEGGLGERLLNENGKMSASNTYPGKLVEK